MTTQIEIAAKLTPKQLAFVEHYQRSGNASDAYRKAYGADDWSPGAIATQAYRMLRHPQISLIVADQVEQAVSIAQSHATASVERLHKLAEVDEDATASRLAVSERANARLLEAAGVLKTGAGVTVNVDARSIDQASLSGWNTAGPDGLTGAERYRASQATIVEPGT